MENFDSVETTVDFLNSNENMEEFINDIVQENLDNFDGEFYNENGNFIYDDVTSNFLKSYENIKNLSEEDFKLILDITIKCLIYKIETKRSAINKAQENANYRDFREYYGSSESAYWHLLEKYLDEFGYHKNFEDFYYEYQEEKTKKTNI